MAGREWVNLQWLFDLAVAGVFAAGGPSALVLLSTIAVASAVALALRGVRLGVLGCSIKLLSPDTLAGIPSTKIGRTGYLYVFDHSRLMIMHPQEERILQRDVPPGANILFDAALEGFEGVGETVNSRGVPMLVSYRQLPGSDWILAAQQEQREASAPIREARNRIIFGIIVAILAVVFIGILSIQKITKPLRQLRDAALRYGRLVDQRQTSTQQVKDEVRSELTSIHSRDEIGDVTNAFVDMMDKLHNTLQSLSASAYRSDRTRPWRQHGGSES